MAEKSTIARPYAQAVFELARDQQALDKWSTIMTNLSLVIQQPEMLQIIQSPDVASDRVIELIGGIIGDELDESGINLLKLLAENERLALVPEIAALYEAERSEAEGAIDAEVTSAHPLSEEQQTALSGALAKRLGREINLAASVDETLIGGAIIRAGDLVIDGSAIAQLGKMNRELMR